MMNLENEQYFLKINGVQNALITDIVGDASFRKYKRITKDNYSAVLVIYPPSERYCFNNFIQLSSYLIKNGFSAPEVIAYDYSSGLMLIEDFGENSFSKILSIRNKLFLYSASIDVLLKLHKLPIKENLEIYSLENMVKELDVFLDYYSLYQNKSVFPKERDDFFSIIRNVFSEAKIKNDSLCLRDFHSPNLIYLENRDNIKQIGIIDFQDAKICSKLYDVVSLVNDARTMVNDTLMNMLLSKYLNGMGIENHKEFYDHFDIIAAQRNLRILGVFARQKLKYNNNYYESFMPIVMTYLRNNLQNSNLIELNKWLKRLNIF